MVRSVGVLAFAQSIGEEAYATKEDANNSKM